MGNMPTVYQRRILDASKKRTGLKKSFSRRFCREIGAGFWVEMKKDGLKISVNSEVFQY